MYSVCIYLRSLICNQAVTVVPQLSGAMPWCPLLQRCMLSDGHGRLMVIGVARSGLIL